MKSHTLAAPGDTVQLQYGIDAQIQPDGSAAIVVSQFAQAYDGYVRLAIRTFDFVVPSREQMLPGYIEALRKEQSRIRAEAERAASKIEDRIQSILAITHSPAKEAL